MNMMKKPESDQILSSAHQGKMRREWGTQNMSALDHMRGPVVNQAQVNVQRKINGFLTRAVFPQQLTIPRQYATTKEGTFVFKTMEGRMIDGYQEQGARVVVQENAKMARFVISPLFSSIHDARSWALQQMGAV
jgi:hypothetical protein